MTDNSKEYLRYLNIAAHDFRGPLRRAHLMMDLVKSELEERDIKLSADGQFAVDHIGESVARLEHLVNDLYVIAKLELDHETISAVDLNEVLTQAELACRELTTESGAEISSTKLPIVRGERAAILSVFVELIENACFHADRATVQISIREYPGANPAMCMIIVQDNGPGVPEDDLAKIFEPFARLSKSPKAEANGLGLTKVQRIMRAYGGNAWCEPCAERGAKLILEFNLARAPN